MNCRERECRALTDLTYARHIANFAADRGFEVKEHVTPAYPDHLGAVMADSILQAGVNYRTVVKPRIKLILENHPNTKKLGGVQTVIAKGILPSFLNWKHAEKIDRFTRLAILFQENEIHTTMDLKHKICSESFRDELLGLKGVGNKTIDYMSCLVGLDSIAVDRHVRTFAIRSGVHISEYDALKRVFSYAADLLESSRRYFDSWVWNIESNKLA